MNCMLKMDFLRDYITKLIRTIWPNCELIDFYSCQECDINDSVRRLSGNYLLFHSHVVYVQEVDWLTGCSQLHYAYAPAALSLQEFIYYESLPCDTIVYHVFMLYQIRKVNETRTAHILPLPLFVWMQSSSISFTSTYTIILYYYCLIFWHRMSFVRASVLDIFVSFPHMSHKHMTYIKCTLHIESKLVGIFVSITILCIYPDD